MVWSFLHTLLIPQAHAACNPAAAGIDLGECLILGNGQTVAATYDTPSVLVNLIVRNLFVVAGIILFILIIYSGFLFISGGSKGQEQAKTIMTTAVGGFLLMFVAYWIVRIVEVIVGQPILL